MEYKDKVVGCMEYTTQGRIGIPGVLKKYREKVAKDSPLQQPPMWAGLS